MFVFISPEAYFFSNMQATTGTTVAGDANRNKNPSVLKTLQFPSTASVTENLYMHANQVEYFRTCYITAKNQRKKWLFEIFHQPLMDFLDCEKWTFVLTTGAVLEEFVLV